MEDFVTTLDDRMLGRSDAVILGEYGLPADHPSVAGFPEGKYLKFVVMAVG